MGVRCHLQLAAELVLSMLLHCAEQEHMDAEYKSTGSWRLVPWLQKYTSNDARQYGEGEALERALGGLRSCECEA